MSCPTCVGHAEERTCHSCFSISQPKGESHTMNTGKKKRGGGGVKIKKKAISLCATGMQCRSHLPWDSCACPFPNPPQAPAAPSPYPASPIPIPPLHCGSKHSPLETNTPPTCKSTGLLHTYLSLSYASLCIYISYIQLRFTLVP